jgi:histidinol-phosphate aminotransferase
MASLMNRRNWLKSGALLAGGVSLLPTSLPALSAGRSAAPITPLANALADEEVLAAALVEQKARLSANENPFGPSAKAMQAATDSLNTCYQYPLEVRSLVQQIAEYEGIKPENILLDAGSSPLLLAAAMHFGQQGAIVTGDPSHADLPRRAAQFKAAIVAVPLAKDYRLDLDAMEKKLDSHTALVYICNPNNPTGTVLDTAKLKAFTKRVSDKVPVLIDEAYIDYLPDPRGTTLIEAVKQGHNVIVARTFSKVYGLAGLRVGYIVAQPEMIKTLSQYTQGPLSISAPAIKAAVASYQDQEYMKNVLAKTQFSKQYLYNTLRREGYEYIPSSANFVLFPLKMDGKRFVEEMGKRGVSIRSWEFNNKHWCRVSIGQMQEMEAFAAAFIQLA